MEIRFLVLFNLHSSFPTYSRTRGWLLDLRLRRSSDWESPENRAKAESVLCLHGSLLSQLGTAYQDNSLCIFSNCWIFNFSSIFPLYSFVWFPFSLIFFPLMFVENLLLCRVLLNLDGYCWVAFSVAGFLVLLLPFVLEVHQKWVIPVEGIKKFHEIHLKRYQTCIEELYSLPLPLFEGFESVGRTHEKFQYSSLRLDNFY